MGSNRKQNHLAVAYVIGKRLGLLNRALFDKSSTEMHELAGRDFVTVAFKWIKSVFKCVIKFGAV